MKTKSGGLTLIFDMLTYNTHLEKLKLPEYGRNIQQMVDYCLTLEDMEERTSCAYTIVKAMEALVPAQGDKNEYRKKLWDHLAYLSDYRLEIDAPYPMERPEEMDTAPRMISRPEQSTANSRHYGDIILKMIKQICTMPESEERDALTLLTANQMKKTLTSVNNDSVDDRRIFDDMYRLSKGEIRVDPEKVKLRVYQAAPKPASGKKKKKK